LAEQAVKQNGLPLEDATLELALLVEDALELELETLELELDELTDELLELVLEALELELLAATTLMANAGNEVATLPSLTEMMMLL
jgi:hypothetical protein